MKLQPKQAKLKKNFTHTDNRKADKVKRGDHKDYLQWLKHQPLQCLECGTLHNIELHHVDSQDDRTVVPFCSYCHRGDERQKRIIYDTVHGNALASVLKGFYLHRGTRSAEFRKKWTDEILLTIAKKLYEQYTQNNR